jgi:hypothetical protein
LRVAYTDRDPPEGKVGGQFLLMVLAASALLGAGLWAAVRIERHRERRQQRLKTITMTAPVDELLGVSLPGAPRRAARS